jgi:LysR family nod box-dependent transcriptional activator
MRLKQFDLNLLVVLDALLTERSATRAGRIINLSQPAVSNALTRLREYFHDELLMHVGHDLVPTALGRSLAAPVHDILVRARTTLASRETFDPKSATRKFAVMASDYVLSVLLAEVAKRTHNVAPGVTFDFYPNIHPATYELEEGFIDLLILPEQFLSSQHDHEFLYHEDFVCMVWSNNRLVGEQISLEQLMEMRQVVVAPAGGRDRYPSMIDQWWIDRIGSSRQVEVVVGTFTAVPQFLLGTTRYAIMHRRLAQLFAKHFELKLLPLPIEFPTLNVAMQWNRHRSEDAGIKWLRQILRLTVNEPPTC